MKQEQPGGMTPDEQMYINQLIANAPPTATGYSIQIVEQPPEKSVYKRNLKPNPSIMVIGDISPSPQYEYKAAVVLIRCDTFQEEPRYLTGDKPVSIPPNRLVTFKKLKVLTTSHQQQESLFSLRFEVRRYVNEEQYEVLASQTSTPVCILSHSTQMKPTSSQVPTILEVLPSSGPSSGGTRVAVVGRDFVDSPAARIRFDSTDVMPSFHGPGTLVCHTPQHEPGPVQVKVCSSSQKWSDSEAMFTYEGTGRDHFNAQIMVGAGGAADDRFLYQSNNAMSSAAWQGHLDNLNALHQAGNSFD